VDSKTNFMARKNSLDGRLVCASMWDHFSLIISRAISIGTLVNKDVTSKEAKQQSEGICIFESFPINCELFMIWLKCGGKLLTKILCKKFAKLCNGLPVEDIIMRKGCPALWILGSPCLYSF